jgi:hypothetical protein
MAQDNNVPVVEVECEICGNILYFLQGAKAAEIRLGVGLHRVSCRRSGSRFPLGMESPEDFETEETEHDKGGGA